MKFFKIKPRLPLEPLEKIDLVRFNVAYYEESTDTFQEAILTVEKPPRESINDDTDLYLHALECFLALYPGHNVIDIDILSEPAPAKPAESEK